MEFSQRKEEPKDYVDRKEQLFRRAYDGKLFATTIEAVDTWIGNGEKLPVRICDRNGTVIGEPVTTVEDFQKRRSQFESELQNDGGALMLIEG